MSVRAHWVAHQIPSLFSLIAAVAIGAAELGPAQVFLDDGQLRGGITKDGGFTLYYRHRSPALRGAGQRFTCPLAAPSPDVPPGSYILSVQAHDHLFDHVSSPLFCRTVPL